MEELTTADQAMVPDRRNELWRILDPSAPEGHRAKELEDIVACMRQHELPDHIPEDIRTAFVITRNLWIYGWFHYPFYTVAASRAYVCLEMALRERWSRESTFGSVPQKYPRGLRQLLDLAVSRGWIRDEGLKAAQAARSRREEMYRSLPPPLNAMFAGDGHPAGYVQCLAESLPPIRNSLAHDHWFGMPHQSEQHIGLVAELIVQLFDPAESARPERSTDDSP